MTDENSNEEPAEEQAPAGEAPADEAPTEQTETAEQPAPQPVAAIAPEKPTVSERFSGAGRAVQAGVVIAAILIVGGAGFALGNTTADDHGDGGFHGRPGFEMSEAGGMPEGAPPPSGSYGTPPQAGGDYGGAARTAAPTGCRPRATAATDEQACPGAGVIGSGGCAACTP